MNLVYCYTCIYLLTSDICIYLLIRVIYRRYRVYRRQFHECKQIHSFDWNNLIYLDYITIWQQCGTVQIHCVAKIGVLTV